MRIDFPNSFEFIEKNEYGVSTISKPTNHTVMYLMKKIEDKLSYIESNEDCFVFVQEGIDIPESLEQRHYFCVVPDSSVAFNQYIDKVYGAKKEKDKLRKYTTTDKGYIVGENVHIGKGTYIEPGVFIDHDVVIGESCEIGTGTILRHCIIGNHCCIYENVLLGNEPFNLKQEENHMEHTISVGDVKIYDYVDIGACSVVDRGTTTSTVLSRNVKVDANVRIGHDTVVSENVEITLGSIIGAFCNIGKNVAIYSSKVSKRLSIGDNSVIGYNSCVLRDVDADVEVFGYPARIIKKMKDNG